MPVSIGPTSLDLPAWFQAVGSVLAIFLAILLAYLESRRRRIEEARIVSGLAAAEIASRARFFQMVALQLNQAIMACEKIAEEEQYLQNQDEPGNIAHSWTYWGESRYELFNSECVDRLKRLEELPLTSWPDIESGLIFGDAVRWFECDFKRIREAALVRGRGSERDHFLSALNQVTYLSEIMTIPFQRFIGMRDHALKIASTRKINIRYSDRNDVDNSLTKSEQDRMGKTIPGNPKSAFISELDLARSLRASLRP